MSDKTRDAIDRTAAKYRESAQRSGVTLTQTEARERVEAARERGDRIRENNNR